MASVTIPLPAMIKTKLNERDIAADAVQTLSKHYQALGILTVEDCEKWQMICANKAPVSTDHLYTVFTDGACAGNPGPGGWATIVRNEQTAQSDEYVGNERNTTNNRMEMSAVIAGLEHVPEGSKVKVVADSEYVIKGITQWLQGWIRNGWQTASKAPVKNKDLWQHLHELTQKRTVEWSWTKGHDGQPENERCDQLAVAAIKR